MASTAKRRLWISDDEADEPDDESQQTQPQPSSPVKHSRRRLVLSDDDDDEDEDAAPAPATEPEIEPEPKPEPEEGPAAMEDEDDDNAWDSEEAEEVEQHLRMVEAMEAAEAGIEAPKETKLQADSRMSPHAREAFDKLSLEQQKVIKIALEKKSGPKASRYRRNVCILGEAGTGKSYLLKTLHLILEERTRAETKGKGIVIMSATSQIVAHGYNAHNVNKVFHFNVYYNEHKKKVMRTGKLIPKFAKDDWANVETLIVDEVSMLNRYMLDFMNECLQVAKGSPLPMGGIQIIFCGDFKQLPPVNVCKNRDNPMSEEPQYAFLSPVWKQLFGGTHGCITVLRQNHRQKSDPEFLRLLRAVRNKQCTPEDFETLASLVRHKPPPDSTMVCPTNRQADRRNDVVIEAMPGDMEELTGELFSVVAGSAKAAPKRTKFHFGPRQGYKDPDELRAKCKVPYTFKIKAGARIVLAANHPLFSWCINGAQGTFLGFKQDGKPGEDIMLIHLDGEPDDLIHELPVFQFKLDEDEKKTTWVEFEQFPLVRGYAMSIHSGQGMTLARVHVGMRSWAPYMLYVGLSRGTNLGGITLEHFQESDIKICPVVVEYYRSIGAEGA